LIKTNGIIIIIIVMVVLLTIAETYILLVHSCRYCLGFLFK